MRHDRKRAPITGLSRKTYPQDDVPEPKSGENDGAITLITDIPMPEACEKEANRNNRLHYAVLTARNAPSQMEGTEQGPAKLAAAYDRGRTPLSRVREVGEEGVAMNNRVASYTTRTAGRRCYLSHVVHAGEEATVEINRAVRVLQSAGPGNRLNAASRCGRRVLGRWGKGFPQGTRGDLPSTIEYCRGAYLSHRRGGSILSRAPACEDGAMPAPAVQSGKLFQGA